MPLPERDYVRIDKKYKTQIKSIAAILDISMLRLLNAIVKKFINDWSNLNDEEKRYYQKGY